MLRLTSLLACIALFVSGCSTHIEPSKEPNTKAERKLGSYAQVQLVPIISADVRSREPDAVKKIDQHLVEEMRTAFPNLDVIGSNNTSGGAGVLRIEPVIEDLKFISGGERFWAGALAGSSAVRLRVNFIDAASGRVIASPTFYQRAAAMGGAYSFGSTDNDMLRRIAVKAGEYARQNL